jgi:hypothetical protein
MSDSRPAPTPWVVFADTEDFWRVLRTVAVPETTRPLGELLAIFIIHIVG